MFSIRSAVRCLGTAALLAVSPFALLSAAAQEECDPANPPAPYVFILLDNSGSMNYSPRCTQAKIDAGLCSFLCPNGDCFVPLQADDPASKSLQIKEALQTVLASQPPVLLGFGTYNQDALRVKAKHWLYQAQGLTATIPGWGSFPTPGAREVFGATWACDTGSGDNEIGCYPASPADLPDAWELGRVRRLSKGGASLNQNMLFYIRNGTTVYRVLYTPAAGQTLGAPTVNVTVRIDRCTNAACTTTVLVDQRTVTWGLVNEFLSWDNIVDRTNPQIGYFPTALDATATASCTGWESNTDSTADPFSGFYNLLWPTDASDLRGPEFAMGDMIPLDWLNDHNVDIQRRLAPNLNLGELVPDFRVSRYLRNLPQANEPFLRLKDEAARPLIVVGTSPLSGSITAFRSWFAAWQSVAAANDPEWACRTKSLLLLTDDPYDCGSSSSGCMSVQYLRNSYGVRTWAVGFGGFSGANQLTCLANNGGTLNPYYPETKQELIDTLNEIFAAAATP
jgi:hypothetical protein